MVISISTKKLLNAFCYINLQEVFYQFSSLVVMWWIKICWQTFNR